MFTLNECIFSYCAWASNETGNWIILRCLEILYFLKDWDFFSIWEQLNGTKQMMMGGYVKIKQIGSTLEEDG